MKIAIFGVGAMGSVYAGLLADAGNEVWAVDPWQDHLEAIAARGLRVEGASGDRMVTGIHVARDPAELPVVELVIIATKASAVGEAARALAPCLGPETLILTIHSGLAKRILQQTCQRACLHAIRSKWTGRTGIIKRFTTE